MLALSHYVADGSPSSASASASAFQVSATIERMAQSSSLAFGQDDGLKERRTTELSPNCTGPERADHKNSGPQRLATHLSSR